MSRRPKPKATLTYPDGVCWCGDAEDSMSHLLEESVQAVIADPPYFNVQTEEEWDTQWKTPEQYLAWTACWIDQAMRVMKQDGLMFIFGQLGKREHVFLHVMSSAARHYQFHDLIIWDRAVGYAARQDSFTSQYEMVLVLRKSDSVKFFKDAVRLPYDAETIELYLKDKRYKDKASREAKLNGGKHATNILRVPSLRGSTTEKCGHPTQKPLALIEMLVQCCTDVGDTVLDPFAGSGTTAEAARKHGRRWIGIEKDSRYLEIMDKRLTGKA